MAIGTTVGLMLGTYGAIDGFIQGNTMRREALKGLEEFEAQELTNAFANVHPSLDAEKTALNTFAESEAGVFDMAQGYNASDAMALVSQGVEANNKARLGTFDAMRKEMASYDVMRAQDEVALRAMQEQREMNEVNSLQAQLFAGSQMRTDALMGAAKMSLGVGLAAEDREAGLGIDPKAARRQRIADNRAERGNSTINHASFMDYMREGDLQGYRENRRLLRDDRAQVDAFVQAQQEGLQSGVNTAQSQLRMSAFNPDGSLRSASNFDGRIYNPDGSFRFGPLAQNNPFAQYGFGSIQPIRFPE
jgi:hypothetical protein